MPWKSSCRLITCWALCRMTNPPNSGFNCSITAWCKPPASTALCANISSLTAEVRDDKSSCAKELSSRVPRLLTRISLCEGNTLDELGVQRYLSIVFEEAGDGAAGLGILCCLIECRLVRTWHFSRGRQQDFGDRRPGVRLVKGYRRLGLERFWRQIGGGELSAQRHGKAARMGRRNQFFRVGADSILESSAKRILAVFQHSALGRDSAFAVFQAAVPHRACCALHMKLLLRRIGE